MKTELSQVVERLRGLPLRSRVIRPTSGRYYAWTKIKEDAWQVERPGRAVLDSEEMATSEIEIHFVPSLTT